MSDYILSCCSTADLAKEHFEARDIKYICFHYLLDGKELPDDLGQTLPFHDFYTAMVNGAETKTSQISIGEYYDYFKGLIQTGKDVLHVTLSTGITGSFTSARTAAGMLATEYPERKIIVIDSLGASSGYGLIMDKLADLRDGGMDIEELADWCDAHKLQMHHWFFSTDLTFYIKGGRVSKTAGAIGGLLGICPLLNMDNTGHLIPREKIRPKKRVIARIVDKMKENAIDGLDYSEKCYMCHSDCYDDARTVADLVEATFPKLNGKVVINNIGTTIGSHSGPGTVALFFWGKERIE